MAQKKKAASGQSVAESSMKKLKTKDNVGEDEQEPAEQQIKLHSDKCNICLVRPGGEVIRGPLVESRFASFTLG